MEDTGFDVHEISGLFDAQSGFDLRFVEADDQLAVGVNNGDAHLAGLVDHFFTLGQVGGHIILSVRDVV